MATPGGRQEYIADDPDAGKEHELYVSSFSASSMANQIEDGSSQAPEEEVATALVTTIPATVAGTTTNETPVEPVVATASDQGSGDEVEEQKKNATEGQEGESPGYRPSTVNSQWQYSVAICRRLK